MVRRSRPALAVELLSDNRRVVGVERSIWQWRRAVPPLPPLEQSNGITRGMSFGVSACQEKKDGSSHRGRAGREGLTRADRATSLARRSSHYRLGPLGLPDCPGFQRVGSLISVMCVTCFHLISALRRYVFDAGTSRPSQRKHKIAPTALLRALRRKRHARAPPALPSRGHSVTAIAIAAECMPCGVALCGQTTRAY